jgi:hypothetical protein
MKFANLNAGNLEDCPRSVKFDAPGQRGSGGLPSRDAAGAPGIHAESVDRGVAFQKWFDHLCDAAVVLAMISLRILLAVPEADRNHSLRVVIRYQTDQVYKAWLLL